MTMITAEEAQKLAHKYRFANNDLERVLCETASTVIDLHQQLADAKAQRQVAATITRLSDQLAQARAACASLVEGKDAMEKCWKDARADAKAAQALVVERDALFRRAALAEEWRDHDKARAEKAEAELAAAKQREAELLAALEDPLVVHLNMVAGKIAKPLPSQLVHIYGEDVIRAALAEVQARDEKMTN